MKSEARVRRRERSDFNLFRFQHSDDFFAVSCFELLEKTKRNNLNEVKKFDSHGFLECEVSRR